MKPSSPRSHEDYTRLLVAHQRRIYGFIYTLVHDHSATDDILQEVAALLWKKFETFEVGTDFAAWAMRVARYKVLEWRRKQQRLPLPIDEELLLDLAAKAEEAHMSDDLGRRDALGIRIASVVAGKANDVDLVVRQVGQRPEASVEAAGERVRMALDTSHAADLSMGDLRR